MLPPSEPTSVAPRPGRSSTACVPDASSSEPGRRMTWRSMGRCAYRHRPPSSACRRSRWRRRPAPCHSAGPGVGRHMAAAGGVQHRLLADPDRTGIGLGHIGLLAHARLLDGNAAAPGIETAQHGDLVRATDLDRAAGIDADARALAHHDGAALRGRSEIQRQVGAGALRQRAAQRSSVYSAGVQRVRTSAGGAPDPGACAAPPSSRSTGMCTSICAPSATVRPL